MLINTIRNRNYSQFNNKYHNQVEGVAMGAPASAVLAEIFNQRLQHTGIIYIFKNTSITADTLTIY